MAYFGVVKCWKQQNYEKAFTECYILFCFFSLLLAPQPLKWKRAILHSFAIGNSKLLTSKFRSSFNRKKKKYFISYVSLPPQVDCTFRLYKSVRLKHRKEWSYPCWKNLFTLSHGCSSFKKVQNHGEIEYNRQNQRQRTGTVLNLDCGHSGLHNCIHLSKLELCSKKDEFYCT